MQFKSILISLLFLSVEASALAQLPDSLNNWETKSFRPITGANLAEFAGDDARLVSEYGFVGGEHREYAKGDARLEVNLWKMRDSSGGFGLYTFYRETGTASLEGSDPVAVWPLRLMIQHGPYVLDATGAKLTFGEARLLVAKIPPLRRSDLLLPDLPGYFPEQNRVPQSQKFILGPVAFARLEKNIPASVIGFEQGAEAEIAEYRTGGGKVELLLVSYPTPQLAAKKLRAFQQLPAISQAKQGSEIFVQRKGPLVGFVLDASASVAESLFNGIRYESEVTWNQFTPTRRDNIGELIVNVFLLAGFVLLFSIVAGLSFGGIRVFAKKFLPVPIFDRPSQVEIIQLHLSD
jgi:uncharacterized protein DUF6599